MSVGGVMNPTTAALQFAGLAPRAAWGFFVRQASRPCACSDESPTPEKTTLQRFF